MPRHRGGPRALPRAQEEHQDQRQEEGRGASAPRTLGPRVAQENEVGGNVILKLAAYNEQSFFDSMEEL